MEIHGENPVRTRSNKEIGDELGSNRRPGRNLAILTGIPVIGKNCGDPFCTGSPESIDEDQELHQMIVGRGRGRLDDKNIPTADILPDFNKNLTVAKTANLYLRQRLFLILRNPLRQRKIRAP
jgi:hypothetical protein